MLIIYLLTKFHVRSSSDPLVLAVKLKVKKNEQSGIAVTLLLCILQIKVPQQIQAFFHDLLPCIILGLYSTRR
jgi:hypothetical protein